MMSKFVFGRSKPIAAALSFVALFSLACATARPSTVARSEPTRESSVTVAPGDLYFVLPRRVCTSLSHVGDTVTAIVWRARKAEANGMIGISPDPAVPDSLQAVMRVTRVAIDSTDSALPIQFVVEEFALGSLRGSAGTRNPGIDFGKASRANTRSFVNVERCYEGGRSLTGGLTDQLVLK